MIVFRRIMLSLGAGVGAAALTFVNLPTRADPGVHPSRATPVRLFYTDIPKSGDADQDAKLGKSKAILKGASAALHRGR
ncbi:hypothetical protein [Allosphingosinicella deserti]|uniref:Uncharacterized protein n=1 Tax=Allosphingosinicella deserti TaxID=2116704 RepID=A0A2P7QS15_9SPHN|nr:hypothetical protein [Sphingomonas deserti]PSJ40749.1 hypothetical protein C7I55_10640 [Sphingomonas deserti]